MNILKKEDGSFSKENLLNGIVLVAALAGLLFPVWQPFIPQGVVPVVVAVIASLNLIARFLSNGSPIQGSGAVKDKLGLPTG